MNNTVINKKLALMMGVIFAVLSLQYLFGLYGGLIVNVLTGEALGGKAFLIVNALFNLPIIICALLIAVNKSLYVNIGARMAAWIFMIFQVLNLLVLIGWFFIGQNVSESVLSVLYIFTYLIKPVLLAGSAVWLYVCLDLWKPLKIVAIISALPNILYDIIWYQIIGKDYQEIASLLMVGGGIRFFNLLLFIAAMILSLIWTMKKPSEPLLKNY